MEAALDKASKEKLDILIVCSGREERFAIDDAYCAGYLVSLVTGRLAADANFSIGDGGQAALAILGYFRDPLKLFEMSDAGRLVMDSGLGKDLEFVLQKDALNTVPVLQKRDSRATPSSFSLLL